MDPNTKYESVSVKFLSAVTVLILLLVGFLSPPAVIAFPTGYQKEGVLIAQNEPSTISWYTEYGRAAKAAATERKWLLVDVYTDRCGYCKKLDSEVFDNPQVARFINQSFVCMKANAERGDGVGIARKFDVHGYPCTLVLDPKGREKGRIFGYLDAKKYPKKLSSIVKKR